LLHKKCKIKCGEMAKKENITNTITKRKENSKDTTKENGEVGR